MGLSWLHRVARGVVWPANVLLRCRLMVTTWWFKTGIVELATLRYVHTFVGERNLEGHMLEYFLGLRMLTCRLYVIAMRWSTYADSSTSCVKVPISGRWIWSVAVSASRLTATILCKMLNCTSGSWAWRCIRGGKITGSLPDGTISCILLYHLESVCCFLPLWLCFATRLRVCGYRVCLLCHNLRTIAVWCLVTVIAIHNRVNEWWPWSSSSWREVRFFELLVIFVRWYIMEDAYNRLVKKPCASSAKKMYLDIYRAVQYTDLCACWVVVTWIRLKVCSLHFKVSKWIVMRRWAWTGFYTVSINVLCPHITASISRSYVSATGTRMPPNECD